MKKKITLCMLSVILVLTGCTAMKTIAAIYNLTNCIFKFKSLTNLTVSGMNLSNGISAIDLPKVLSLLNGGTSSIPMNFTVNFDVNNPNQGTAAFEAIDYILSIDDMQFTTGSFNQAFSIGAGETKQLPMTIGLDLAQLLKGDTKNSVTNIIKNFIGIGTTESKVNVQLKPSFKVGEQTFKSPAYIPINFSFGGKK